MVIGKLGKLPALRGSVNLLSAALVLATAGCLPSPGRTVPSVPVGEWLAPLGNARRAPYLEESAPEAPEEVWREGTERGLVAPPIVHADLLILGSTGRVLTAASAVTGGEYWHRRFNGPVVGSPLRTGESIVVATAERDGRLRAYSVARGRQLWQRRLRAPVSNEPLLHDGRVYAATLRGELYAVDAEHGSVQWRTRLPGPVLGAPVVHDGALLLATANDTLVRLRLEDGARLGAVAMPGTITAPPALAGGRLLIPCHPNLIASYEPGALQLVRVDTVDSPVLAAPAVDANGDVYVLSRAGTVWRLGAAGLERVAALRGAARESLSLARNGLLVGSLDGTLVLLRRDGTEVWRRSYPGSIRAPVALAGGAAYVGLLNGRLVKLQ